LPGAPFDAAYSRMALMLLADPVAGCVSIRRALRPGGRLAATVFRDAAASPWLPAALLGAGPAGAAYRAADPGQQAAARHGAAILLDGFRTPGKGYQLPVGIWLLTARRPGPAEPAA
jgi:SAM-dependent methyltransferase